MDQHGHERGRRLLVHPADRHADATPHARRGPAVVDGALAPDPVSARRPRGHLDAREPPVGPPAGPLFLLDGMSWPSGPTSLCPPSWPRPTGRSPTPSTGSPPCSCTWCASTGLRPWPWPSTCRAPPSGTRWSPTTRPAARDPRRPAAAVRHHPRGPRRRSPSPCVEVAGFEADDVLATLATEARDRACDVIVVTGDRDCFQLVEDPHVRVLYNRRGVSDYTLYDEAGIVERTGVAPPCTRCWPPSGATPRTTSPASRGWGRRPPPSSSTPTATSTASSPTCAALSPKLRENLAAHEAQVRANAPVIPLVRDVPPRPAVTDLDLGGWDLDTVQGHLRSSCELRTGWDASSASSRTGHFGPPAAGSASARADDGRRPRGRRRSDRPGRAPPSFAWPCPSIVRPTRPRRAAALEALADRTGDGPLAVAGAGGRPGAPPCREWPS